jgi:hypothetical protein
LIASTTERLKYSLNSQKPGSLTWEKAIEPQETASTVAELARLDPVVQDRTHERQVLGAHLAPLGHDLAVGEPDELALERHRRLRLAARRSSTR